MSPIQRFHCINVDIIYVQVILVYCFAFGFQEKFIWTLAFYFHIITGFKLLISNFRKKIQTNRVATRIGPNSLCSRLLRIEAVIKFLLWRNLFNFIIISFIICSKEKSFARKMSQVVAIKTIQGLWVKNILR